MTTIDPMTTIGDIHALSSTLSGLGSELSSAASTGGFEAVFSQVNAELAAIDGGTGTTSSSSPATAASSLSLGSAVPTGGSWSAPPTGADVVGDAEQYLGVPYQWGGTSATTGFDCSGLVQHVYADLGISLPRTSEQQATVGSPVASLADAQPGDLVFFAGSDGTASSPGHVGIYIGNGQMIDAPQTGQNVQIQAVGNPVAIRRILPSDTSTGASFASLLSSTNGFGYAGLASSGGLGLASTNGPGYPGLTSTGGGGTAAMNNLGVPSSLQPLFEVAGARYGVDPTLLAAVAKQESGFNPGAVSGAGAEGLMQLMPATAAGLGVDPANASESIDGAAQLLSGYLKQYHGSVPLSLAAYNAGPNAVSEYGGVPPYGETQNYVSSITSMLSNAEAVA